MTVSRRNLLGLAAAMPVAAVGAAVGAALPIATLGTPARASTGAMGQPAGLYRFKLGDVTVTALLDGHIPIAPELIVGLDPAKAEAALADHGHRGGLSNHQIPINGYLIERGDQKVLIDAGAAGTMGPGGGGLLPALGAAGVAPEDITLILATHLHLDHVGGLIDGNGQAVFANAELAVADVEYGFWHDDAILAAVPQENRGFFDIARAAVAPYADRLQLFSGEGEVARGILSVPMPGHTPGHTGFQIDAGPDSLLIWGDLIHSTALQFAHPDWTVVFDGDPALTVDSRKRFLDRAAADDLLVAGMHLDFPGLGRVARSGSGADGGSGPGYRYQAAPWQALL